MFGLNCTSCSRPLTWPFVSHVFTDDGQEFTVNNKLPDGVVDGNGAIVLYLHGNCGRQGRYSAKMQRRAAKQARQRYAEPQTRQRPQRSFADKLRDMGYGVAARGKRVLMVLPNRTAEVKRL